MEELRYERKYLITDYSWRDVEQLIKLNPACFSEIFHERIVNNIYFDTPGFSNYYDNVEGSPDRLKVRIRWYGNVFGKIEKPVLEYKIKHGLLGKKETYNLNSFTINEAFSESEIIKALNIEGIPKNIKNELLSMKPALLNSYTRKYFLSKDKNFRITIDRNLTYYRINYSGNTFTNKVTDHQSTVLELKYDASMQEEARAVSDKLPFALTKNSKYLHGLERVFF